MTCTDPEIGRLIGSYELGLLSKEEEERLDAHLWECDQCFQDVGRMEPVATRLREARLAPTGEFDPAEDEDREDATGPATVIRPARWFRARWGGWAAAAAAAVVLAVALRLLIPWQGEARLRGPGEEVIGVVSPSGDTPASVELVWEGVPGAGVYEVRILDHRLEPVWSGTAEGPPAILPQSVREALEPGETYFWQVETFSEEGVHWKSRLIRFTITD